jgi:hypothetical protein
MYYADIIVKIVKYGMEMEIKNLTTTTFFIMHQDTVH